MKLSVLSSMDDKVFLRELGKHIKAIRVAKGHKKQVEFAYLLEMEASNLNRIEKGGTNPTILMLKKIADALDVPVARLVELA